MATVICSNHPANEARFECLPCRRYYCYVCAKRTQAGGTSVDQCTKCGGVLLALQPGSRGHLQHMAKPTAPPPGAGGGVGAGAAAVAMPQKSLVSRLGDAPLYLVRPSVVAVLAGLAIINGAFIFFGTFVPLLALFGALLLFGLESALYFHVVERTAYGDDDLEAPDFDHIWDAIFAPIIRYLAASLPIIIGTVWLASSVFRDVFGGVAAVELNPKMVFNYPGPLALIVIGIAIWPVTTMVAAMSKSTFQTLNPLIWVATLRQLGVDYFIAAIGFYAVFAIELFVLTPALAFVLVKVDVPILGPALFAFIGYFPMVLRARVLGTVVEKHI